MRKALIVILIVVTIVSLASLVRAQPLGAVFIDPPATSQQVCTNFDVYVRENLIAPVFGFELYILFNPAALEVIDLEEGADILARAPNYFTVVLIYDNFIGRVDVAIALLVGAPPLDPVSELVHVAFHCKGDVDTALDLEVTVLIDVNMNIIPPDQYTVEDGFVNQYTTIPVGGEWVPIDKLNLLTPWISLISAVAVAASFVCGKRIKKLQN